MRMFAGRHNRARRQPSRIGPVANGLIVLIAAIELFGAAAVTHAADPFLRHTATVSVVEKIGPSGELR